MKSLGTTLAMYHMDLLHNQCAFTSLLSYSLTHSLTHSGVIPNSILRAQLGYTLSEVEIPTYTPYYKSEDGPNKDDRTSDNTLAVSAMNEVLSRTSTLSTSESQTQQDNEATDELEQGLVTCISGVLESEAPMATTSEASGRQEGLKDSVTGSSLGGQPERKDEGGFGDEGTAGEAHHSPSFSVGDKGEAHGQRKAQTMMAGRLGPIREEQSPAKKG